MTLSLSSSCPSRAPRLHPHSPLTLAFASLLPRSSFHLSHHHHHRSLPLHRSSSIPRQYVQTQNNKKIKHNKFHSSFLRANPLHKASSPFSLTNFNAPTPTPHSNKTRPCHHVMSSVPTTESHQHQPPPAIDFQSSSLPKATATEPGGNGVWRRSHTCGQLNPSHQGETVILQGWVDAVRDKGQLSFILLRDRHGVTQATISDQSPELARLIVKQVRIEYVVQLKGVVLLRQKDAINSNMDTGYIEVLVDTLEILSTTKPLPFSISDAVTSKITATSTSSTAEETKLKFRYLDLRKHAIQSNIVARHRATMAVRNYLDQHGFLEIETPILTKATPEGARDYLVPSRVHKGKWYALPQSPQIYKQLLMVASMDRYFQITKCFRDEDLRQDRQPEFTQIDMEMSFVNREDIMNVAEGLIRHMWKVVANHDIGHVPWITYNQAIDQYGLDAPDTRFQMLLQNVTSHEAVRTSQFTPLKTAFQNDPTASNFIVKAMVVPGGEKFSRKMIDAYTAFVKTFGLSGLVYGKVGETDGGLVSGPLAKLIQDAQGNSDAAAMTAWCRDVLDAKPGDLVLLAVGKPKVIHPALGRLRVKIAQEHHMIPQDAFAFCWVVDFPLFEYDDDAQRYVSVHHPFTSPIPQHVHLLDDSSQYAHITAAAYDLVCNGNEIGGGSIRIHRQALQQKIFHALAISPEDQQLKFGFLLDALSYGAPPHGGLAFGLDRCIMLMRRADSLRDVIAFPKTTSAADIMAGAPSQVEPVQLEELYVKNVNVDDK